MFYEKLLLKIYNTLSVFYFCIVCNAVSFCLRNGILTTITLID